VNWTAVCHLFATIIVGAGVFVSDQSLTVGLLVAGAALFVVGIVIARRGDNAGADLGQLE